jgi:putative inorganic carbon (hco3(-)) transporter
VAGLIARARLLERSHLSGRTGGLLWLLGAGLPAALVLAWLLTVSVQAAAALVLVLLVVALHQHDRRWGITAMFAFWFLAPGLRRVLGLMTGYVDTDPLSVAPFAATAAIAALELVQIRLSSRAGRVLLLAGAGFALGLPAGLLVGPRAAVYAFCAYLAALAAAVLGFNERSTSLGASTLRRVLLVALPPIAAYAIAQRVLPLPDWDQAWLDATDFNSIGASRDDEIRVFASLNSPGALAPLLALSLLCYLTVRPRHMSLAVIGATLLSVALALTLVRSAWLSLIVAALAHVIASRGSSARLVFGAAAVIAAVTLALSPVSATARDVVDRFGTFRSLGADRSVSDRSTTLSTTLPEALSRPFGHGLGTAGEPSKLTGGEALRTPDNGYLSLMYQVGPIGFLLVMLPAAYMLWAAWIGARTRAPGQELRLLLFAILVFTLVQMGAGDQLYGSNAVIFWFAGGQVLAYELLRRRPASAAARPQ